MLSNKGLLKGKEVMICFLFPVWCLYKDLFHRTVINAIANSTLCLWSMWVCQLRAVYMNTILYGVCLHQWNGRCATTVLFPYNTGSYSTCQINSIQQHMQWHMEQHSKTLFAVWNGVKLQSWYKALNGREKELNHDLFDFQYRTVTAGITANGSWGLARLL